MAGLQDEWGVLPFGSRNLLSNISMSDSMGRLGSHSEQSSHREVYFGSFDAVFETNFE